jgi:UDP-2,3-diacylglucosamine pyrophosphatase LpxH
MKLLLLHLSDIHIKGSTDRILKFSTEIAAATVPHLMDLSAVFIVVSGDIAYSGLQQEYLAAHSFLDAIRDSIRAETDAVVYYILVPGNHDCDFSGDQTIRDALIAAAQREPYSLSHAIIRECLKVQTNYAKFEHTCAPTKRVEVHPLWVSYEFDISGQRVVFDCLNSSWMSTLKEKQGQLVFPVEDLPTPTGRTDLRVAVLHHPLNWYGQPTYQAFRTFLRNLGQIVITGHEHHQTFGEILDAESSLSTYVEGGVLQEDGAKFHPTFNIIDVDLETAQYRCELGVWNGAMFLSKDVLAWQGFRRLPQNTNNEFGLTAEFEGVLSGTGAAFNHPAKRDLELADIYIYPDLRTTLESGKKLRETRSSEILRDDTLLRDGVLIKGEEKTGKSSLLYQLYRHFHSAGKLPLYLRGEDLRPTDRDLRKAV